MVVTTRAIGALLFFSACSISPAEGIFPRRSAVYTTLSLEFFDTKQGWAPLIQTQSAGRQGFWQEFGIRAPQNGPRMSGKVRLLPRRGGDFRWTAQIEVRLLPHTSSGNLLLPETSWKKASSKIAHLLPRADGTWDFQIALPMPYPSLIRGHLQLEPDPIWELERQWPEARLSFSAANHKN